MEEMGCVWRRRGGWSWFGSEMRVYEEGKCVYEVNWETLYEIFETIA